jgi:hypothetical protein
LDNGLGPLKGALSRAEQVEILPVERAPLVGRRPFGAGLAPPLALSWAPMLSATGSLEANDCWRSL